LTVAGPAVVLVAPAVDRDTHLGRKTGPAARAGPCTPRELNPAALPEPVAGPVSAPHGPVSVLALALAPHGPALVVLVA
jgi:hypothetical protein